jgi:hypothetical protein
LLSYREAVSASGFEALLACPDGVKKRLGDAKMMQNARKTRVMNGTILELLDILNPSLITPREIVIQRKISGGYTRNNTD